MPDPANPVQVTLADGAIEPCNFTLHQNPANGANSAIWTNDETSTATWRLNTAPALLSNQAPPNGNNPASNTYDILAGGTLQLWVKDNAAIGNGVSANYTVTVNGDQSGCVTQDPPDMLIEP